MSFFEKNSTRFDEFSIGTTCLDFSNTEKECRHWILYRNGKVDQLSRQKIIDLLNTQKIPIPLHYTHTTNNKNDKNDKKNFFSCILS